MMSELAASGTNPRSTNGIRKRVPSSATTDEIQKIVVADAAFAKFIEGKPVRKFIYVPQKLANVVV